MNNPALPHGLERRLPFRRFERAKGKSAEKNFCSLYAA
jgi:hypothetical protein